MSAPGNFMNWKLEAITLPRNVAELELELELRSLLGKKRAGITDAGGLVVGVYSTELARHTLPRKKFVDVTTRDVLLTAADLDRGFLTLVEFPRGRPNTDSDFDAAFLKWRWLPLRSKEMD